MHLLVVHLAVCSDRLEVADRVEGSVVALDRGLWQRRRLCRQRAEDDRQGE
ncbi:MAG: hypothetical protein ACYTFN_19130 [Planctomycetota bacterium]